MFRGTCSIAETVADLDGLDVGSLDRSAVQAAFAELARVKGWHDGLHVRLTRRLRELAVASPSILPEDDIAKATKTSRANANQATRRADTLDAIPEMEGALSAGDCSAEHVDSLGRAMNRFEAEQRSLLAGDGERLARLAKHSTPEEFDKALAKEIVRLDGREGTDRLTRQRRAARFRSWTDRDTGMVCFRGELDPESGLRVISRIEAAADASFHGGVPEDCPEGDGKQDFLRSTALTRLVLRRRPRTAASSAPAADDGGRADRNADADVVAAGADGTFVDRSDNGPDHSPDHSPDDGPDDCTSDGSGDWSEVDIDHLDNRCDLIVVIDLDTLIHGLHDTSIVENGLGVDLPLESYRRMACNATIIPAVLDSNGVVVDVGRTVRLANKHQRRALLAMYDMCAIPGCAVSSRHCQPHHIHWWRHLGDTDLDNLIPLCSRHHHAVHEGGWHLVMHTDRSLTIAYPGGVVQNTGPPDRRRAAA